MSVHVVLYEPEIPQNTGNIIRTCVAAHAKLHLIEPLGFDLQNKAVKRSTCNLLDDADIVTYASFQEFISMNKGEYYFLTRYGRKPYSDFAFSDRNREIYLIFGKESTGIPYEILRDHLARCLRIPMYPSVRSLNLGNSVSIVLYEVMRQQGFPSLSCCEVQKGEDFLESFDM